MNDNWEDWTEVKEGEDIMLGLDTTKMNRNGYRPKDAPIVSEGDGYIFIDARPTKENDYD